MTEARLHIKNILLACGLTLSLAGCETARFQENEPFSGDDPQSGYRYDNLAAFSAGNSEEVFVILTFSGGGTRAAAFAYGVLEKLGRTTINFDGEGGVSNVVEISFRRSPAGNKLPVHAARSMPRAERGSARDSHPSTFRMMI